MSLLEDLSRVEEEEEEVEAKGGLRVPYAKNTRIDKEEEVTLDVN